MTVAVIILAAVVSGLAILGIGCWIGFRRGFDRGYLGGLNANALGLSEQSWVGSQTYDSLRRLFPR